MSVRAVIRGSGSALPRQVVSNADLALRVDTTDEWIVERTGIRNRHIAGEGETTATLAADAARAALEAAGVANAVAVAARLLEDDLTHRISADLTELGEVKLRSNARAKSTSDEGQAA